MYCGISVSGVRVLLFNPHQVTPAVAPSQCNEPMMLTSVRQSELRADKKRVLFLSADLLLGQQARKPPSTGRVTPFVMLLLSLSRNKMLFTTSSTSAGGDTAHSQRRVSLEESKDQSRVELLKRLHFDIQSRIMTFKEQKPDQVKRFSESKALTCKVAERDARGQGLGLFRVTPTQTSHLCHHHCRVHCVHPDLITTFALESNISAYS